MQKDVYDAFVVLSEQLTAIDQKVDALLEVLEEAADDLDELEEEGGDEAIENVRETVTAQKKPKE